jgi:hypothetical protein
MSEEIDVRVVFQAAVQQLELESETPLRQLTRKILNEERKYLYSEQGVSQRKRNIKIFIESARKSGQFK